MRIGKICGLLALLLVLALPELALAQNIRVCLQSNAATAEFEVVKGQYDINGGKLTVEKLAEASAGDIVRAVRSGSGFTIYVNGEQVGTSGQNVSILAAESKDEDDKKDNDEKKDKDDKKDNILRFGGRAYRGSFSLLTNGYVLNILDVEEYLYGVVGQEIGYSAPREALRVQAIVSRSYAYFNLGGTYYDVSATESSQVYGGYTAETAQGGGNVVAAVDDTAHQVLYYGDDLVEAVFASSAGGYTENNENVWGGQAVPYLRAVESPYDKDGYFMDWTVEYTPAELRELAENYMQRIGQKGSFGAFVRLEVSYAAAGGGSTKSGRATSASLVGTSATVTAKNDAVRTMLNLRSNLFEITGSVAVDNRNDGQTGQSGSSGSSVGSDDSKVYVLGAGGEVAERDWRELWAVGSGESKRLLGDSDTAYMRSGGGIHPLHKVLLEDHSTPRPAQPVQSATAEGVVLRGHGYGHGVGLSQYGAIGMAKDGYTAMEILRHYYGGTNSSLLTLKEIK